MALKPADCLVPEIAESESVVVELLEKTVDLYLSTGLRCIDVTPERKNLFDVTLRQKYQESGWYLVYRSFGVAGWHIVFSACGPEDNQRDQTPIGRLGRPATDFGPPAATKAGQVGPVTVDGNPTQYAPLPPHPSRLMTHAASVTEAPSQPDAPKKESKRGNG